MMTKRLSVLLIFTLAPTSALAQSLRDSAPELFSTPLQLVELETLAAAGTEASLAPSSSVFSSGRWTTPAKWVTLGFSVGLGLYGFVLHEQADDAFDQLVLVCQSDPVNCRDTHPDGSYRDPELEDLFQQAATKDDQAQASLIAANLFFAASAALFIIDFQGKDAPGDIPYHPEGEKQLQLSVTPGQIVLRFFVD